MSMRLANTDFLPCLSGAAYAPQHNALLVADLHLEKGSSRAHKGVLLPPYDTRAGLLALEAAITRWAPARVILLGVSFHDVAGPQRMAKDDRALLERIAGLTELTWLSGNHDPALPSDLPGFQTHEMRLDNITLRHEPVPGAHNEIAGHLHPVAAVRQRGRRLRRKCFVVAPSRIILPAFGAYTGGLDVRDEAFKALLPGDGFHAIMIGKNTLQTMPARAVL